MVSRKSISWLTLRWGYRPWDWVEGGPKRLDDVPPVQVFEALGAGIGRESLGEKHVVPAVLAVRTLLFGPDVWVVDVAPSLSPPFGRLDLGLDTDEPLAGNANDDVRLIVSLGRLHLRLDPDRLDVAVVVVDLPARFLARLVEEPLEQVRSEAVGLGWV